MTPHEELLVHSQPVNRTAALHVAGGDRLGREELLWAQREAFEKAMSDARLRNMEREQENRREFARAGGRIAGLKPGSFYLKDWKKHVDKLRHRSGMNQKLDNKIRAITVMRLAPTSAPDEAPKPIPKNAGPMRRRNAKRYGPRGRSVAAALGVFNEVLKQKA